MSVEAGKVVNEIDQDEIEEGDVSAQKKHGDDDDERRIGQLLITPDPLVLRFPRPGSLLQLGPDFRKEAFCFRDHEEESYNRYNVTKSQTRNWKNDVTCNFFNLLTPLIKPGQEGLEPPTDGFGDRYSTN